MEKVLGRANIQLISKNNINKLKKIILDGEMKNFDIISPDLTIVSLEKKDVLLKNFTYIGAMILEISKLHIYKMIYEKNGLMGFLGNDMILSYIDTDGLVFQTSCDIYEKFKNKDFARLMDLSPFPNDFKKKMGYSDENKGKIGTWKVECCSFNNELDQIKEFMCFRAKSYYYKLDSSYEKIKTKGVKDKALKNLKSCDLNEINYYNRRIDITQTTFKSVKNVIHTVNITLKNILSNSDDKRQSDKRYSNTTNKDIITVPLFYLYPNDKEVDEILVFFRETNLIIKEENEIKKEYRSILIPSQHNENIRQYEEFMEMMEIDLKYDNYYSNDFN